MASVHTLSAVDTVQLKSTDFVARLRTHPTIAIAMIKQMSARLREAQAVRVDLTLDVTRRVAKYILQLARAHGIPQPLVTIAGRGEEIGGAVY